MCSSSINANMFNGISFIHFTGKGPRCWRSSLCLSLNSTGMNNTEGRSVPSTKHVADHYHQAPHPESTSKFTFVYLCCFGRLKIIMSGWLHGSSMYDYLLLLQTPETVLTYIILHYSQVLLCVCIDLPHIEISFSTPKIWLLLINMWC